MKNILAKYKPEELMVIATLPLVILAAVVSVIWTSNRNTTVAKPTVVKEVQNQVPENLIASNDIMYVHYIKSGDWTAGKEATNIGIKSKVEGMIVYDVTVNSHDCATSLFDIDTIANTNQDVWYKASCKSGDIRHLSVSTNKGTLSYYNGRMF